MERLTLVVIGLFVVLFLGQLYLREYFVTADMEKSTITMTLSELLYTIGVRTKKMQEQEQEHEQEQEQEQEKEKDYRNGYGYGQRQRYRNNGNNQLQQYLMMKNDMLDGVKTGLDTLPSALTPSSNLSNLSACKPTCGTPPINMNVSPSCLQGSAYMESVPLVTSSC
jgi:hypothetical protein